MLSKFLRSTYRMPNKTGLLLSRRFPPKVINVRCVEMIPASQYDIPFPKRLKLGHTLRCYWEVIPLFFVTCLSITMVISSILWAFKNKVDTVFSSHSRENISRTMDLRNPTVHKLIIINQRYEAWPELANALDKMKLAERRAQMRAQSCTQP